MTPTVVLWRFHEKLLHRVAWQFQKRFGGDHDELFSDACMGFLKAARTWSPERARFSTWLTRVAWQTLAEVRRKRERKELPTVNLAEQAWRGMESKREKCLSSDARTVVSKVTKRRRSPVAEALAELGWAGDRLAEAIREIGGSL